MEVEKDLDLICKEFLTDAQTTYNNGYASPCRLCRDTDNPCSDAERAVHWVYHVADESNSFWNVQGGRALTGEQLLDCVRQTNVRFREGRVSSLMSARVYVCERCFTHHAVIQSRNAPHETSEGRLVCAGCV